MALYVRFTADDEPWSRYLIPLDVYEPHRIWMVCPCCGTIAELDDVDDSSEDQVFYPVLCHDPTCSLAHDADEQPPSPLTRERLARFEARRFH